MKLYSISGLRCLKVFQVIFKFKNLRISITLVHTYLIIDNNFLYTYYDKNILKNMNRTELNRNENK